MAQLRESRVRKGLPEPPGLGWSPLARQSREAPAGRPRVVMRKYRGSDRAFIRLLSQEAFSRYGEYAGTLAEWLASGMALTWVALRGRRRAGFVMLSRLPETEPRSAATELLAIAVERESRRQGVGGSLLREALVQAREAGLASIILHTAWDNRGARRLFEEHGFTVLELKPRFYPAGQDAVVMGRWLIP